jgi:MFS transporter, putative metabolite:H+ symporter
MSPDPVGSDSTRAPRDRSIELALLSIAAYRGFVEAIPGTSASFVRASFELDEAGLARLMSAIALASAGALWVGRLFDVRGRRPVLLACLAAVPVCSLLTAAAPGLIAYAAMQMALFALVTAILAGAGVVMAETMPDASRTAALGRVGVADAVGGGIAILLMPMAAAAPGTWRWLWAIAVLPIVGIAALRKTLPETPHWERRDAAQSLRTLLTTHRARTVHLTGSLLLLQTAFGGLLFWPYYHAVETAQLSLGAASFMILAGGAISLGGFAVGSWLADRIGRRITVVIGTFGTVAAGAAFYLSGPDASAWFLGAAYTAFLGSSAIALLAVQAATLEIFPTEARATAATWNAALSATGVVIAQTAVAALAERAGGLSVAVALSGLLAIPGAVWFACALPETRGVALGEAAQGAGDGREG